MINDPVQGLVDYANEIKPYHTKVVEVLIDYIYEESIKVVIKDSIAFGITLELDNYTEYCDHGFGILPYGEAFSEPSYVTFTIVAIEQNANAFIIGGQVDQFFEEGGTLTIDQNGQGWSIDSIVINPSIKNTFKVVVVEPIVDIVGSTITINQTSNFDLPDKCNKIPETVASVKITEEIVFIFDEISFDEHLHVRMSEDRSEFPQIPYSGSAIGAFDYPRWDMGGFDESTETRDPKKP